MIKSKDLRDFLISHYRNGKNASRISTTLVDKLHRATVHRWTRRFNQSSSINGRKSPEDDALGEVID